MKEIKISKNESEIRFSKYIKKILPDMPDSLIYKLFRKKYFELNGKKAIGNEILKVGDKISIFISDETYDKFRKEKKFASRFKQVELSQDVVKNIIYEDENIIVFYKDKGILSQGDKSGDITVNDILNTYLSNNNSKESDLYRPSVINRLDRNTEGLIIFAKTYIASREISKMIKDGKFIKCYKTLVNGIVNTDEDVLINLYKKDVKINKAIIKKYDGEILPNFSIVKLEYKVIEKFKSSTLLDINLITGKSHQIRAQLSYIGHPIVCDRKYMDDKLYKENVKEFNKDSQELICYKIKFDNFSDESLKKLDNKEFKINKTFIKE